MTFDLLIAGAGPVGCVVAGRAARELGWRCLVVDRRRHIAGNCYDYAHESGVLVHAYGPHSFRTNNPAVLEFLSRYTAWVPGNYVVKSSVDGQLYPFPINLITLEKFFGRSFSPESAEAFLKTERVPIENPTNSEELILSRVGRRLYEKFYLGYTLKQWGVHPRELAPWVAGRIPVRLNRDERYVDHAHQVMPADGFTAMFARMLDHPNVALQLGADFRDVTMTVTPTRATLFTGPVDEYFDHALGRLPWRSLDFRFEAFDEEYRQPCLQINYPNEHTYTRSVEIKHATGQRHSKTVISYETPQGTGDPYYPIPMPASAALYERYRALAALETRENRVFFAGRLATYRYINTDEAVEDAFAIFERIKTECRATI